MKRGLHSIKTIVFYNLSSSANESRTKTGICNKGEMAVLRSQSQMKVKFTYLNSSTCEYVHPPTESRVLIFLFASFIR